VAGRRRGARTGRGWDAAPPRPARVHREAADGAAEPVRPGGGQPSGPGPDPAEVAREICLRQLAVRPRTRAELATALRRRGIAAEVAAEVLDRYDEVGMIDDVAFARAWVSSRHHGRGLARRALAAELRQRGVDSDAAGRALAQLDDETEDATARDLVARRLRTSSGPPEAVFRRLVAMLARKGYPPGIAVRAVRDAMAAAEATAAAEFAERIDADALGDALADSAADDPTADPSDPRHAERAWPAGRSEDV
jgi:regulatory protein